MGQRQKQEVQLIHHPSKKKKKDGGVLARVVAAKEARNDYTLNIF